MRSNDFMESAGRTGRTERGQSNLAAAQVARSVDRGFHAVVIVIGLFLLMPRAVRAEIPVPLCFEPAEGGAVMVRAIGGGRFQVIPPGGTDDQRDTHAEAVVPIGATVKLQGVRFQQYVQIMALVPGAVQVRNAGWARFVGEFDQVRNIALGCGAPAIRPTASPRFSFSGIGLASRIEEIAREFPNSKRVGDYLYIAPQDARDQIFGIEISGSGALRRARLSFESPWAAGPKRYPACQDIQKIVESRYGPPTSARSFAEERSRRSDRVWQGNGERMTLQCFLGSSAGWQAEAVVIVATGR